MKVPKTVLERQLLDSGFSAIAGVDEVGRGAWAGPLVAAAVVLRQSRRIYRIRDSKLLNSAKRMKLSAIIKRRCRSWGIGVVEPKELNRLGLTKAVKLAQVRATRALKHRPDIILCDGRANYRVDRIKTKHIVKGDRDIMSVACASIVAKVYRDKLMERLSRLYPAYHFNVHKGYGTQVHRRAIKQQGVCPEHRLFYKPLQKYC